VPHHGEEGADHHAPKEVTAISLNKHRIDKNSMRVLFFALPASPNIQTLKFTNNGLTHSQMSLLVEYMTQEVCPVLNLFIDWNPIYADDYVQAMADHNPLYKKKTPDEICLFAKL
jgi:hypothetical protein